MRAARFTSIFMAAVAGLALTLSAQSLPGLPKDAVLPQSEGSPGAVTFSHERHLAVQERRDCLACHPRLFKTLEPHATADRAPISHAQMEQKKQCGACHNGEDASGLDDCTRCHRM